MCVTLKSRANQCSGKSIAKSLLNDKGIRYNGDGMLLGKLNVVNVGLLLGVAEDEYRGGGLGKKSQSTTSIYCQGSLQLIHMVTYTTILKPRATD